MLCLDVELRRRNKGTFGACDLMAEVVRRFALHSEEAESYGVDYRDIRDALKACPGGSSMGPFLDRLVKSRALPNIKKALSYFRLRLDPHAKDTEGHGWLGVNLRDQGGKVQVSTFHAGSPLRMHLQVGDELLAVDGVRLKSSQHLAKLVSGRTGQRIQLEVAHEGILNTVEVEVMASPQHGVTLSGRGNDHWKNWITTRQSQ
jgi:predicted metalloprotease with PDZ domain